MDWLLNRSLFFLLGLALLWSASEIGGTAAKPTNVTYDHRAIVIDGKRQLLLSGCIHYPRSTPSMWPRLFQLSKEAGLNVIQTYVFWNLHEKEQGKYDFETDIANLPHFLELAQEHGLWVNLRIGPYVCAEWDYGGFPEWLQPIPDIVFRDYSEPFMKAMGNWMTYLVHRLRPYFAPNGGPIILAQVENEYGWVEKQYGVNGTKYAKWAIEFARSLDIGIPWIMCSQDDIATAIDTCNGFYCHQWLKDHWSTFPDQPGLWTENWPGWFQDWGQPAPSRPVEDIAFAAANWFAYGGTHQNYYMWHGGTNFERWSGGPFITTNYDYDVALDEYGYPNEPKYSHSKRLHTVLMQYQDALLQNDPPTPTSLGPSQLAFQYGSGASSIAFLINNDVNSADVTFQNKKYTIPGWSVTLVSNGNVLFNTATIEKAEEKENVLAVPSVAAPLSFTWYPEPAGKWGNNSKTFNKPHELISLTEDKTDYLWYTRSIQVDSANPTLDLPNINDVAHIFVDGRFQASARGPHVKTTLSVSSGTHELQILAMTVGLINYGLHMEAYQSGLLGQVLLNGKDITTGSWLHTVGLNGEALKLYTPTGSHRVTWNTNSSYVNRPLTWMKASFTRPGGNAPIGIDMTGMNKGFIWVNGRGLGRYWLVTGEGTCQECDYRGTYSPDKCRVGCGHPSQSIYHVPTDWLHPGDNMLAIFEEIGGDPSKISLKRLTGGSICASEQQSSSVTAYLHCDPNTYIRSVDFASYGTPSGSCGNYKKGSCDAASSLETVKSLCLGRSRCSIAPTNDVFGGDPCPGTTKTLSIQVTCGQ